MTFNVKVGNKQLTTLIKLHIIFFKQMTSLSYISHSQQQLMK